MKTAPFDWFDKCFGRASLRWLLLLTAVCSVGCFGKPLWSDGPPRSRTSDDANPPAMLVPSMSYLENSQAQTYNDRNRDRLVNH